MERQEKLSPEVVDPQEKRLARKVRFIAVVYRIVLVAGLLVLIAAAVLLLVTDLFNGFILLLPAALITLGFILAWIEYHLDMRLYNFQNPDSNAGENKTD